MLRCERTGLSAFSFFLYYEQVCRRRAVGGCWYDTARDGEMEGTDELSRRKILLLAMGGRAKM